MGFWGFGVLGFWGGVGFEDQKVPRRRRRTLPFTRPCRRRLVKTATNLDNVYVKNTFFTMILDCINQTEENCARDKTWSTQEGGGNLNWYSVWTKREGMLEIQPHVVKSSIPCLLLLIWKPQNRSLNVKTGAHQFPLYERHHIALPILLCPVYDWEFILVIPCNNIRG